MNNTLGWLHLSDLHFLDRHAWRDSQSLKMLIEDLEVLLKKGLRVDLVLCTGDIGFGETKKEPLEDQYADAKAFFDKVLETCRLGIDRLFVVPGNHDIDRSKVLESQTKWFRSGEHDSDAINQKFRDRYAEIQQALQRLAAYRKFVADHYPHIKLDDNSTFGAAIAINGITPVDLDGPNGIMNVPDPAGRASSNSLRKFNDLQRRADDLQALVSSSCVSIFHIKEILMRKQLNAVH